MATSNSISENAISFYASGGHAHDGSTSSLIKTDAYSIYDFNPSFIGDNPERRRAQVNNYNSFRQLVVNTINSTVLEPAGIVLQDNIINSRNIISGSITATEIAANTITADNIAAGAITANQIAANTITANQIAAGAVTANELAANIVLVNNYITSGNFDGTIAANGAVTNAGTVGWAVTSYGHAVFDTTFIRGSISASEVLTPGVDIYSNGTLAGGSFTLYGNGAIVTSSGNFSVDASGNLYAQNVDITGEINATSGSVSGNLVSGGTISGVELQIGSNFAVDAFGNLSAQNASISGTITTGSITGDLTLTNTGQVIGPGQVNVYGVMAEIIIANDEFALGNNRGIKCLGNFSTTSSSTTARIHAPGSGGEIIRAPSSLRELKYNIQDINNALDILNQIRPRQYNWHIDGIDKLDPTTNKPWSDEARAIADLSISYGFIAQEIGEDCPALTVYKSPSLDLPKDQPGGYYDLSAWTPAMWKEMDMIPLLVKAVQELSEKIQSLEARLTEIEG